MLLNSHVPMSELLAVYGQEPYGDASVLARWQEYEQQWMYWAREMGEIRQFLLRIHQEIAPDEVWPMPTKLKKGGIHYAKDY